MIPLEKSAWSWYLLITRFGFKQLTWVVLFVRATVILSYLLFVA